MPEEPEQLGNPALTVRERDILRLLANGLADREIADAASLTVGTVKWYNRQIYNKLGVRNRIEAVTRAQRLGLLDKQRPSAVTAPSPASKHQLPAPVNSFVGRIHELAGLKAVLLNSRLVTLTGSPGTGKTRLALEAASALQASYPDGIYFIPLASLRDASLIAHTVAQVLAIKEADNLPILELLKAALGDKQSLLVLDNFEHLLGAASLVSDLLTAAPRLTVLATSREVLRLYGEQEFVVPPLHLPDLKEHLSVERLQSYEAVELFVQRARAAHYGFTLSRDNAAAVAAICVHLDGLPLAIELAAARIRYYAPQGLLRQLGNRLEALGEGARNLSARQHTLRAALAWSYDLLTPEEQRLFARLGVFAGGFSIADAEAICGDNLNRGTASAIESLLGKSLLQQTQSVIDQSRFTMLETMREYALEKLAERGENDLIRQRHARYFLGLIEQANPELTGPNEADWYARLESQHGNFNAALQWSLSADDTEQTGLRLTSGLHSFWWTRGYLSEGRAWLEGALKHRAARVPTPLRAGALTGAGSIAYQQCDYPAAREFYREALDIYRQLGDQHGIANIALSLGDVETSIGDYDAAELLFQQGAQLMQELGDKNGFAHALDFLAWCRLRGQGDYAQAAVWFQQALVLFRQVSNMSGSGLALSGLGEIALRQGKFEQAAQLLEQSLKLRQQLGQRWGIAATLGSMAWVAQLQRDFQRAAALLGESWLIRRDIGDPGGMAWCLEKLAEIAYLQQDFARAARVFGAAAALRLSVSSIIDPNDQPEYDRLIEGLRKKLGEDIYQAVRSEGAAMPLERLVEYLALPGRTPGEV